MSVNFPIAIFGGGPGEIVIILGILLLLFGSTKLPKLARSLGSSVTEFKKGIRGEDDDGKKRNIQNSVLTGPEKLYPKS